MLGENLIVSFGSEQGLVNYQVPEHFWTSGKSSAYHEGSWLSFYNYHYRSFQTYDFDAFLKSHLKSNYRESSTSFPQTYIL
jgi:hypothetical protein